MNSTYLPNGILTLFCLLLGFTLYAQDPGNTPAQEKIKAAKERIEQKIADLEARYTRGELSESEFENALDEAVEELTESIEDAQEDLEEAFDGDDDKFIDIQSDSSKNRIKLGFGSERRSHKRTKAYMLINLGPSMAFEQLENPDVFQPEFKPWRSISGNLGFLFSTRLGGPSSFAYVNYGLTYKFITLDTKDDYQLSVVDGHPEYIPSSYTNSLQKSRLSRGSITIPVQVRFAGKGSNAFNLMLGGYGGIRLYAVQNLEYKSAIGEKVKMQLYDDYQTNLWHYGATAAVGQRWWQLFADYELSNLFKDNPNYEYNVLTTGLQFFW